MGERGEDMQQRKTGRNRIVSLMIRTLPGEPPGAPGGTKLVQRSYNDNNKMLTWVYSVYIACIYCIACIYV